MPTINRSAKKVTKADLAFIDSAIAMQRSLLGATATAANSPSVSLENPVACDPVDVAAAVVAVAVLAYHVYNSCLIGEAQEAVLTASHLNVQPTVSFESLLVKRNELAKALGEHSVLAR